MKGAQNLLAVSAANHKQKVVKISRDRNDSMISEESEILTSAFSSSSSSETDIKEMGINELARHCKLTTTISSLSFLNLWSKKDSNYAYVILKALTNYYAFASN